ncbi:MAG TPA: hypothetical protein VF905_12000 [Nitrospirota bacterium]
MFGGNTLIAGLMQQREMRSMVSNEAEDTSGRTSAEIERVIYARVTDFKFLERAAGAERQEQWSIKIPKTDENAGSGSIRVRKVTNLREPGAAIQYVLTSKLDVGAGGSSAETSEQSSIDQFNVFKYLANKGMLKDRYVFPIEGSDLNWEVDCFPKPGELYFEWVKIDLEKWPSGKELPPLPFAAAEMMDGDKTNQNEETKAKISRLYEDVFLLPNTKEPLAAYEQPGSGQPGVAADADLNKGMGPGANDDEQQQDPAGSADASGSGSADGKSAGSDDQTAGGNDGAGAGSDGADSGNEGKDADGAGSGKGAAGSSSEGDDDQTADDAKGADSGES